MSKARARMAGLEVGRSNLLQKWRLCDGSAQAAHRDIGPEWPVLAHDDTIPGGMEARKLQQNLLNRALCSVPGHTYPDWNSDVWP